MASRFSYSRFGKLDQTTGVFTPWPVLPLDQRGARERFIDERVGEPLPRFGKERSERYKAWLRTQEYVARFPAGGSGTYPINIPGIQDFIRIPSLEDKALRRQRFQRFARTPGVLPEPLRWIPNALNKLDDAQDLLFTALALSIPLVKRLPAFFLRALTPFVLLNDLLNLLTCLLGLAMGGAITKPNARRAWIRQRSVGRSLIARGPEFFSKFPWLGFLLQAPQALQTLTGYGLNLGTMMGFITDLMWTPYRLAKGEAVTFVGPPPDDAIGKAARYLSQPAAHMARGQMFSFEDHLLLSAADIVATTILSQAGTTQQLLSRQDEAASFEVGSIDPWNPATVDVLDEADWDATEPGVYPFPEIGETVTYFEAVSSISSGVPAWMAELAAGEARSELGQLFFYLLTDGGETVLEWLNGGELWWEDQLDPHEDVVMKMIERRVFPIAPIAGEDLRLLSIRVQELAAAVGETDYSAETLKRALNDLLGGHRAL